MTAIRWQDVVEGGPAPELADPKVPLLAQNFILAHVNSSLDATGFDGEPGPKTRMARICLAAHMATMMLRRGIVGYQSEQHAGPVGESFAVLPLVALGTFSTTAYGVIYAMLVRGSAHRAGLLLGGKVHFDDRRWKSLLEAIKGDPARVRVGVLVNSTHKPPEGKKGGEISMLELAAIHEFGSPAAGIPERSFIRSTVNGKRGEIGAAIESIVGRAMKTLLARESLHRGDVEESVKKSLGLLGAKVVSMMRATIRAGIAPPLRPATIARKKSSKPLIDTGALMNSLTWQVTDGKETSE